ncbi:MAG TPA: substrate-binding domain-containing protein, partial [Paraburkholderia sp.]|nr:substrate-binding domain-containing protein [Paraburkholderia sp.]
FRQTLRDRFPHLKLIDASGGQGLDAATERRVRKAIDSGQKIAAVYSMGGGNAAILRALKALRQNPTCFIGHDLDRENVQLLREGSVTAILHHDLRQDMRSACQHVMSYHKLLPLAAVSPSSSVVVVTPENIPPEIAMRFAERR